MRASPPWRAGCWERCLRWWCAEAAGACFPHLEPMITSGQSGHIRKRYEAFLQKNDLTRRVILTVPTFTAAAMAVARTDYGAGIPRQDKRSRKKARILIQPQ